MRILHVYKDFCPPVRGGMERHMALMCRYQRQWAQVEALTCSRSLQTSVVERDGTRVTEVGETGRFQSAPLSAAFPLVLRRLVRDVTVVHVPFPTAEAGWMLGRPGGRLVVRYQSDVVRQAFAMKIYGPVQASFLRAADVILVASEQYLESSKSLAPVREKCRVVPLGIVPEEFHWPDERRVAELKERYGSPFVLFSGRHRYYKGLEHLVRAAKRIDAPVVIAGDGPERARCMELAEDLGVNVAFPGELSDGDLVNHLHACEVFAFPSCERSEAYGLSMLEAQACGKPVVATRLGTGVDFVNLDGQTGINVPPKDPDALAEAINALLADENLRRRYGGFAQRRVEKEFDARVIARKEFEIYQGLWG